MSKNENRTLKLIICSLMVIASLFLNAATEIKMVAWGYCSIGLLLLGLTSFLIFYRGYNLAIGKIAKESDLDADIVYRIDQVVRLKGGYSLLLLEASLNYKTEVVIEPRDGLKKFEILDDKYLVPKKLKAQLLNGSLWVPVPYS